MLRTNVMTLAVASLAALLVGAGTVQAQLGIRGPGAGFGGRAGGGLMLVRNEVVQKDLGLSAEAVEKLTKLAESLQAETRAEMQKITGEGGFQGLQNLSAEQRQEIQKKLADATQKIRDKVEPQIKEILTPEQQTRLHQIGWQAAGSAALADATVAKELGLSDDQKKQIAQANEEAMAKSRELFQAAAGNFQEVGPKMQELNKARDEKLLGVLSADQKAAFEKLKGKPFDVSQLRGGFGGGRGKPGAAGRPGRAGAEAKPGDAPKQ